ncbi:hypothetical protein ACIQMR_33650 [Streptomyces sp. NPDC091376]|uniref:hypothetical protein n=1 Tax=Streptomyces sp. NPDC091376 TaxID=3365994 RepID=UPI00382DC296
MNRKRNLFLPDGTAASHRPADAQARAAQLLVASSARDATDCETLLSALGLLNRAPSADTAAGA